MQLGAAWRQREAPERIQAVFDLGGEDMKKEDYDVGPPTQEERDRILANLEQDNSGESDEYDPDMNQLLGPQAHEVQWAAPRARHGNS